MTKGRILMGMGMAVVLAAGCGLSVHTHKTAVGSPGSTSASTTTTSSVPATTTTACPLSGGSGTTVPISDVCSSAGAPHFNTPQDAMTYLAAAWNTNNVQEIDYVTSPAGRQQMDTMASLMPNLQFKSCTANPAGDYTCYFSHTIVPSTSPTTYPNPQGYAAGEAVFTVAPATAPGWYLTEVEHCG